MNRDLLYLLLGLDRSATTEDIKRAYRSRVKQCHPDKGGDPEAFRQIAQAFKILSDPQARARYDQTGRTAPPPNPTTEAGALLAGLIIQVITQHPKEMRRVDLIGELRSSLEKGFEKLSEAREKLAREMRRIITVERRLVKNGEASPPFLLGALQERKHGIITDLQKYPHTKEVIKKAISLLEDYSYRFEKEKTATYYAFSYGGSGTTASSF